MIKSKMRQYLLFTLLFVGIWSILLLPFWLRGNSLIAEGDGFNQSYPVFGYIGNYIRVGLRGLFPQFDFRIGLGDSVFAVLNVHGFGDVLQIIAAVVPAKYSEVAYSITMILKYYLCGITFFIFIRRYVTHYYLRIAGALLYAFCIYGLICGLRFWMFINPMITLPLILCGIDQVIEKRNRISWLLIIGLFIQSMNGFYFIYMEILIAIIFFFVVVLVRRKENIISCICAVLCQGIPGVGLGGFLLLPSILGFLTSTRTANSNVFVGNKLWEWLIHGDYKYYLQNVSNLLIPDAYGPVITIPVVVLVGLVLLFTGKKKYKEFRILFGLTGVLFYLPIIGSIMNGFSYSSDRWYFAIILFGIVQTVLSMQDEESITHKKKYIFWLVGFVSVAVNLVMSEKSMGIFLRTAIFAILIYLCPYIWNRKEKREIWFLMYAVITIVVSGLFMIGPRILGGTGYSAGFKPNQAAWAEIENSIAGIEKENSDFHRLDIYNSSRGAALVMNYYGTSEYFSMINTYVSEFYSNLFISPGMHASWDVNGLDSRAELEALLSVSKYTDFVTDSEQIRPIIITNHSMLPFGFTYDKWIGRDHFEQLNPMEKSSTMIDYAVLENISEINKNFILTPDQQLDFSLEYIAIEKSDDQWYTNNESRIRIWFNAFSQYDDLVNKNGEIYIQLDDFILYSQGFHDFFVGNKSLQLRNRETAYYMGNDQFWVNVSEIHEADGKYYFDIYGLGENCYSLRNIKIFFHAIDRDKIMKRAENSLNELRIENNRISGKINTEKQELLFLSLPYSSGWTATVDGIAAKIYRTNIAFVSVMLEPGEHEVCFTYRTPGLTAGIIISIISLLLLIMRFVGEKSHLWKA